MKRGEVIKAITRAAKAGALVFTSHALDEMEDDDEAPASVAAAVAAASSFTRQHDGTWRVCGEGLTVVVAARESVVVVTVFVS
ncbi:MAG: hypothetical protein EXR72_08655 [Myxococcales bacterium]|nr:hypothetical protein [Myxococcales bacterium]